MHAGHYPGDIVREFCPKGISQCYHRYCPVTEITYYTNLSDWNRAFCKTGFQRIARLFMTVDLAKNICSRLRGSQSIGQSTAINQSNGVSIVRSTVSLLYRTAGCLPALRVDLSAVGANVTDGSRRWRDL